MRAGDTPLPGQTFHAQGTAREGNGQWTVDGRQWTVDGRQWTVDERQWTVSLARTVLLVSLFSLLSSQKPTRMRAP